MPITVASMGWRCVSRTVVVGGAFEYTDPAHQDKGVSFTIRSESINMRVTQP